MFPETSRAGGGLSSGGSATAAAIAAGAAGQARDENFPVALRLLPARHRHHLAAVYGFARSADDMGDEAPPPVRLALLDELEADIGRLYRCLGDGHGILPPAADGGPGLAVVRALAPAVSACAIPVQPFLDLIEANRQDQKVTRYDDFGGLLAYCRLSANPVGWIVLHIFGVAGAGRRALSDNVCTALQLAEHIQDVAEDLRQGRIYLPVSDMARFGCTEDDLRAPAASPGVRSLIAFEVERARGLLDEGAPLVGTLRGAARVAVAGYVAGGRAALAGIAASGHDVLRGTPRAGRARTAVELVRAYATGR